MAPVVYLMIRAVGIMWRKGCSMTWQFDTNLNPDRTLTVPADVAAQLDPNTTVHVVLMTGDAAEEADWHRLAAEQFLEGYGPGDEIYDQLPAG